MSIIQGNAVGGAGDPLDELGLIEHSLRFRKSANPYLQRVTVTPTSSTKRAWVFWLKSMALTSGTEMIYSCSTTAGGGTRFGIRWNNYRLEFYQWNGSGYDFQVITNRVFRDPTSHMMVRIVIDTATGFSIQINSDPVETSFATNNFSAPEATMYPCVAGYYERWGYHPSDDCMDCLLSRACSVDGWTTAPANTDFGQFHPTTDQWRPKSAAACKAVVDAGGANSFMLDFNDGTSLTTLGNDFSSKNNDWTLNNHSLTAGVTYDWMLDTPTNNYATLNPIWPSAANISYANLRSGTTEVRGTIPVSNSYWEVTAAGLNVTAGVVDSTTNTNTTTVTANKVFGFRLSAAGALDYINITDAGSWTSITTGLTGDRYAYGTTAAADWNFGQRPFSGTVPTGFKALCTKNLLLTGTVTVSGSFTGNASADGPFVWCNGSPETLTINSNAVTFGTHADRTAGGFKLRTSSSSYNAAGSNSWTATILSPEIKSYFRYQNARGN